jgi:hypothetical protein
MIKVKFAAVITAVVTGMFIASVQARPLPQTGVATIQLAAGRARVLSEPTPPPFVPPTYAPPPTFKLPSWEPTQPNLAPPGSFPGRVSRRAFAPPAK